MYPYASEDLNVAALLATWLDKDRQAKFLIDDQMHVLWQNRAGLVWLRDRHAPLKLAAGRLAANDSSLRARLAAAVDKCQANDDRAGLTVAIKEQGAEHDWLLCLRHVGPLGGRSTLELAIRHLNSDQAHDLVGLRDAFQLTASEEAILAQMVKGNTVEVIASGTGSSRETVRTHVRRAYSKMGVSSREEMFRRMRPFLFARHGGPFAL